MNTPLLAARVPADVVADLDALAAAQGKTRSDIVREALARILDEARQEKAPAT
jgi:predicted transcriptional regulator